MYCQADRLYSRYAFEPPSTVSISDRRAATRRANRGWVGYLAHRISRLRVQLRSPLDVHSPTAQHHATCLPAGGACQGEGSKLVSWNARSYLSGPTPAPRPLQWARG